MITHESYRERNVREHARTIAVKRYRERIGADPDSARDCSLSPHQERERDTFAREHCRHEESPGSTQSGRSSASGDREALLNEQRCEDRSGSDDNDINTVDGDNNKEHDCNEGCSRIMQRPVSSSDNRDHADVIMTTTEAEIMTSCDHSIIDTPIDYMRAPMMVQDTRERDDHPSDLSIWPLFVTPPRQSQYRAVLAPGNLTFTDNHKPETPNENTDIDNNGMMLTHTERMAVMNTRVAWPRCAYDEASVRRRDVTLHCARDRLDAMFDRLLRFCDYPEIAIDGMNGVGKTTLCSRIGNRVPMKINLLLPSVTRGSDYNINPLKCMQYATAIMSTDEVPRDQCHGRLWDRCHYSNLIFYLVHHLMACYRNSADGVPARYEDVLSNARAFTDKIHLSHIINYVNAMRPLPTVFVICSDLDLVCQSLLRRGHINDAYNAKEIDYLRAQAHSYVYFARILNAPLVDLAVASECSDMSLDQIHEILCAYLSYRGIRARVTLDEGVSQRERETYARISETASSTMKWTR